MTITASWSVTLALLINLTVACGDWVDTNAVQVSSLDGAEVYDVKVDGGRFRRVIVIPTPPSEHSAAQDLLHSSCAMWHPTHSVSEKNHINSYSCVFNTTLADRLVNDFVGSHAALLRQAHGIQRCQKRTTQSADQPLRIYVTASHSAMPPDTWHADGCDRDTKTGQAYFTVLHYPHSRDWIDSWGGHLEFAPQECDGPLDGVTSSTTPPVLRLKPSPHRAIVFTGPLLHRATQPTEEAAEHVEQAPSTWIAEHGAIAAQQAGWRYSFVRQLECAIVPGVAADGTPLDADEAEGATRKSSSSPHWGSHVVLLSALGSLCMLGVCALVLNGGKQDVRKKDGHAKDRRMKDAREAATSVNSTCVPSRPEAIDVMDIVSSRCCRGCGLLLMCMCVWPALVARCVWAALPDLRWKPICGAVAGLASVELGSGDDWPFECVKLHCPTQSLGCLFDDDCRQLVRQMTVTDACPGGHQAIREAVCGEDCSATALHLLECLHAEGAVCVYASGGLPVVVRRGALSEEEMATLVTISQTANASHGSLHRTFGADDGTTGHNVTFLTPHIYEHRGLLRRLRSFLYAANAEGGWAIDDIDELSLRCAEYLSYSGQGLSTGLGWHWDLGSTFTMVLMLDSSDDLRNGQLQVSSDCTTLEVPLERGDVAIYRSHQRHRVTTVTKRRSVVVLEWWRAGPTQGPERPGADAWLLMEPATRDLYLPSLFISPLWRRLMPRVSTENEPEQSNTVEEPRVEL